MRLGRAIAHVVKRSPRRHKIIIGKDTRLSGYMLESALTSGICSMGVDVLLGRADADARHRLPHPQHARRRRRGDLRLAQSVSGQRHQVLRQQRLQARPTSVEREIERSGARRRRSRICGRPPTEVGKAFRIDDALGRYNVFLKSTFPQPLHARRAEGRRSTARTAPRYRVGPEVLEELGADGDRDRRRSGRREHQPRLRRAASRSSSPQRVRASGAHIGVALDGDARPGHLRRRARRGRRRRRGAGDARHRAAARRPPAATTASSPR